MENNLVIFSHGLPLLVTVTYNKCSSDMDPLKDLGSLRTKRGHTMCPGCHKLYNNKGRPEYCTEDGCNGYLGGDAKEKEAKSDARMITSSIASVRLHRAGVGVRIFVDLKENKVCKKLNKSCDFF